MNYRLMKYFQLQNIKINIPEIIEFEELSKDELYKVLQYFNNDFININTSDEPLSLLNFNLVPDKNATVTYVSNEPSNMTGILELTWNTLVDKL